MDTLLQIRRNLLDLKCELNNIRVELKSRKWLRAAIKAGFTPDQPRDEQGRWTNSAFVTDVVTTDDDAIITGTTPLDIIAARPQFSLAECEGQYKRDTFHCTMVGLPSCHRQAAQRYAACLGGTQIPPLSY